MGEADLFESLRLELRRGSLILAVLARLRSEQYGYSLRTALAEDGIEMEESTLYPLLRRLEGQGLLLSVGARRRSGRSASTACRPKARRC